CLGPTARSSSERSCSSPSSAGPSTGSSIAPSASSGARPPRPEPANPESRSGVGMAHHEEPSRPLFFSLSCATGRQILEMSSSSDPSPRIGRPHGGRVPMTHPRIALLVVCVFLGPASSRAWAQAGATEAPHATIAELLRYEPTGLSLLRPYERGKVPVV